MAGQTVELLTVGMDQGTTGAATLSFADIAIVSSNGGLPRSD